MTALDRRLYLLVSFFVLLIACAATSVRAAPGDVIRKVMTQLPAGQSAGTNAFVQSDGKIVVTGTASWGQNVFALTRYNADGTLDTAFGNGGTVYQAIAPVSAVAHDALQQADGKIVMVGDVSQGSALGQAGIARFNADGTLDQSFGGGGALASVGSGWTEGRGVAMQSTGKYVIGVNARTMTTGTLAAVRFNPDGTRDMSFGSGGSWLDTDTFFEQMDGVVVMIGGIVISVYMPLFAMISKLAG